MKLFKNCSSLSLEEFDLPLPTNYEDMLKNSDSLFADLLVRYYYTQNNT